MRHSDDSKLIYSSRVRLRPRKPKVEVSEAPAKVARKKVEGENTPATSMPDSKQGRKSLSDLFTHREDKVILSTIMLLKV